MKPLGRILGALLMGALLLVPFETLAKDSRFPNPTGFVNDRAGILSDQQRVQLENLCKEAKRKANIEIAIVIMEVIPDGEAISAYTVDLGHHWGVGTKGTDRGAVLLYTTGRGQDKREIYLATGYGLEGDIPDAKAGRILDQVTIPAIMQDQVFEAFATTIATIVSIVEPTVQLTGAPEPRRIRNAPQREGGNVIVNIVFMMILLLLFLFAPPRLRTLMFYMLLGSMLGGRRSQWGSGGGGFGGGFGGFGGGGFGGGGAGRSF